MLEPVRDGRKKRREELLWRVFESGKVQLKESTRRLSSKLKGIETE